MLLPPAPQKPKKPDPLEQLLLRPEFETIPVSIVTHAEAVPLGVLVRGTLEWLLDDRLLEQLFREHAPEQYTRELTMTTLVGLLIQVSAGVRSSVYAAYKADRTGPAPTITTSFQALYGKLARMSPAASEALVRHSADKFGALLRSMGAVLEETVPGYRLRILDGNVLAGTDHRLQPLRKWLNACLPGKSLVVYEPALGLVTDVVLCEDAYTQERALLIQLLARVRHGDLWMADRNFCTTRFVFGVAEKQAFFVVRQHRRNLPCTPISRLRKCGQTDTATVYEQQVRVTDPDSGAQLVLRRIELRLFEKTRDGECTLALLTNLPNAVSALTIASLYRERWTIEKHFQFLTQSLNCEVQGLGQPRAALLLFAMSLVAGNALAVVRGSLRQAHGAKVEAEISGYYLADEAAFDCHSLMKYLPADQWLGWKSLKTKPLGRLLIALARKVNVAALTRSKRGSKKSPAIKPVYDRKHKHRSTARLLNEVEDSC